MNIPKYLSLARRAELLLSESFLLVADRHGKNPEILQQATTFAAWSSRHAEDIESQLPRKERKPSLEPDRLHSALFHDPRVGTLGIVRDLHGLAVLAEYVHVCWTVLLQGAYARKDETLVQFCMRCDAETTRQIAWLRTHLKVTSPQALAVPGSAAKEAKLSMPARPGPVSLPDLAWGPLATGGLLLAIGVLSILFKQPWLVASLGPSAWLIGTEASHPAARVYNTVLGHALGLLGGLAAVAIFSAWADPAVLSTGILTPARMLASVIAIVLTMLVSLPLRAEHPPAAATALLVALGSINTPIEFAHVMAGVVLLASFGLILRRLRIGQARRNRVRAAAPRAAGPAWAPAPRLSRPEA